MQCVHFGAGLLGKLFEPIGFYERSKVLLPLLGFAAPAVLTIFVPTSQAFGAGDGSGTSNPALRAGYGQTCTQGLNCPPVVQNPQPTYQRAVIIPHAPEAALASEENVERSINCDLIAPAGGYDPACGVPPIKTGPQSVSKEVYAPIELPPRQEYVEVQSQPLGSQYDAPQEQTRPLGLQPDWSVALRGTYTSESGTGTFGASIAPEFSLIGQTGRGSYSLSGNGEAIVEMGGDARLSSGALGVSIDQSLDRMTSVAGGANLALSSASATAPGTSGGIATQPLLISGSGNVAVTRNIGRVGLQLRGGLSRQIYGDTVLDTGIFVNNSERNSFGVEGALRASLPISRTTSMFVEAGLSRDKYDAPSTSLGVALDSWTYAVRAGVSGNWRNILQGEISGGYGLRRFDAASLSDTPAWLAAASLSYRPEERMSLTGSISSAFSAPETGLGATSQMDYIASLAAQYRFNQRLNLRANLGAQMSYIASTAQSGWSVTSGAGLDFSLNRQTSLTADYVYATGQSVTGTQQDSHQFSLGMRYSR